MASRVDFPEGDPRRNLPRFARAITDGTIAGLSTLCNAIVAAAKQNASDIEAVDRGFLRSSIDYRITGRSVRNIEAVVFVGAKHGVWVEYGRKGKLKDPTNNPEAAKAAFPPIKVIEDWVRRNNKKLAPSGRTKSGRARRAKDEDVRALAFLIARKIALYGIKPRPYFTPAVRQFQGQLPVFIKRAVEARFVGASRITSFRRTS